MLSLIQPLSIYQVLNLLNHRSILLLSQQKMLVK
nr:MAG TPA: hypothetical protein [Caudoviricetes sp.]DAW73224.1 MAG TPA: hypothetical protein [Caudoviricetes sp.]